MNVGYVPGMGPLRRSHPFTALTVAAATVVLAFALPAPWATGALCALAIGLTLIEGVSRVLKAALFTVLPFWIFLFLIHAVARGSSATTLGIAARITTIVVAFLTTLAVVHPARLVDAMLERGFPFSVTCVFAATLQAVPRLRQRAGEILEAQRCRGLVVRGSPWRRARSVVPLAVPLILGAIAELDTRTMALEARGAAHVVRRTALHPPPDTQRERQFRWGLFIAVVATVVFRAI